MTIYFALLVLIGTHKHSMQKWPYLQNWIYSLCVTADNQTDWTLSIRIWCANKVRDAISMFQILVLLHPLMWRRSAEILFAKFRTNFLSNHREYRKSLMHTLFWLITCQLSRNGLFGRTWWHKSTCRQFSLANIRSFAYQWLHAHAITPNP